MLTSKWHMHRMGLIDFWYYVNDEFLFKDGHMLLRGSNGSGKSVTMQSFIPLLLDGNKSSERLDSFGTRSRKIENYLLEEDSDRDDRIGYLYLEFKREDSDIYKTIGMGLHARKNKPVDAWYFVIEDNRRINHEIQLMEHNLAITKQMLKNLLGVQYIETQKEYMDRVNQALFDFPSRDDYREAINLLLQLRSPKLSNSLKPTMINEILSNSLQPLSEEDLRPMSEAISNMDEIKEQLEALKQSHTAAEKIAGIYEQYNYACLQRKVSTFLIDEQKEKTTKNRMREQEELKETSGQKLEQTNQQKKQLQIEQDILNEEYNTLVKQDVMQLVEDVDRYKRDLGVQVTTFQAKTSQEEEKDNQRIDIKKELEAHQNKKDSSLYDIQHTFDDMCLLQETIQFEEHDILQKELMENLEHVYDFGYTITRIEEELASLQEGMKLFATIDNENVLLNTFMNEKEQLEVELEKVEVELKDYEQQFYALQEEYKERFSIWNKDNSLLKLSDEAMLQIFDQIQLFEEEDTYHVIDKIIHDVYFNQYQELVKAIGQLENAMKNMDSLLLETADALNYWKELHDPTPEMDRYMEASRNYLKEQGVHAIPFYSILEYHASVPNKARDHFEEQLQRMGLLNALIINEADREIILNMPEGMADQFIFINRDITKLAEYEIMWHDGQIDLQHLLHQIGVEGSTIAIYENWYQNGIVTGTLSQQLKTTYIGQNAREAYRQSKILEFDEKLKELRVQRDAMKTQHDVLKVNQEALETQFHSYPSKADIALAKQDMRDTERRQQQVMGSINGIKKQIVTHDDILHGLHLKITTIADLLGIASTKNVFQVRIEGFSEYRQLVQELKTNHLLYRNACDLWKSADNRLQDIQMDLDTIRYEHGQMKDAIYKLEQLIQQKEAQLKEQGYQDVKIRIDEILQRRREIPEEISRLDTQSGDLLGMIRRCSESLISLEKEFQEQKKQKECSFTQYLEELKLGYVIKDSEDIKIGDVQKRIQKVYPTLKSKDTLGNELQTAFYTNRGFLQEYGLSLFELFETQAECMRLDINARYKGVRISFGQLLENLQNDIVQQSILLEDSDRSLIEDILVNTISRKIRIHIQNSRRWVEQMNYYMTSMNTSSGLKLGLQWKSHKAENEEELSSENLVKLLEKDIHILKESDLQHLSSHFRSKIATARKLSEQQDNNDSFHMVMRKVMDYRAWFDFRILYEKTGEKKKELTNNAFYAFSGGEKAMSMYIPLFSAVAAKFEGAAEDAPLLIALDEAFAGVDEKNINNMFELIAKFKFDYIMNSQVLWGDYPSVSALAIHELFRPENARFVTVISYEWDGHKKCMVNRS